MMTKPVIVLCALSSLFFSCRKERVPQPTPTENIPVWTVFNTGNSPLPDNQINTLAIDRNDTKWIGTSKGLIRLQKNDWKIFDLANSPLPSLYIQSLTVEENGTVWIGTSEGLARLTGNNWKVYTPANSQLTHKGITSLAHDAKNKITYVGTEGSTIRIDQHDQWTVLEESDNPVLSLAVDKNGVLWAGAFNYFAFMGRIRKFDGQWSSINLAEHGYTSSFPYSITIDKNNKPLVALSGTAVRSVVRVNTSSLEEVPFSSAAIGFKTIVAEGDRIWGAGSGVSIIGSKDHPNLSIPGTDSPIQTMAIDSKGSKWLGTVYGGLVRYHDR